MEQENQNRTDIKWIKDSLNELKENDKSIQKKIDDGFTATHKKQDYTNGRLNKAENEIGKLQTRMMVVWGIITAIGLGLLSLMFKVFGELISNGL